MSILDRAKTHFENIGIQSIDVPEWSDDDGKPAIIYWNPINLYEKNKLFKNYIGLLFILKGFARCCQSLKFYCSKPY